MKKNVIVFTVIGVVVVLAVGAVLATSLFSGKEVNTNLTVLASASPPSVVTSGVIGTNFYVTSDYLIYRKANSTLYKRDVDTGIETVISAENANPYYYFSQDCWADGITIHAGLIKGTIMTLEMIVMSMFAI